jgi:polyphosphate kinase 2 (PPK2 family)
VFSAIRAVRDTEGRKMKIHSKSFRVRPGKKVDLRKWPTIVKPFYKSKKRYQKLLEKHVQELSSLQQLHYASNRYALLLIFQGIDSAGTGGAHRFVSQSGVRFLHTEPTVSYTQVGRTHKPSTPRF